MLFLDLLHQQVGSLLAVQVKTIAVIDPHASEAVVNKLLGEG